MFRVAFLAVMALVSAPLLSTASLAQTAAPQPAAEPVSPTPVQPVAPPPVAPQVVPPAPQTGYSTDLTAPEGTAPQATVAPVAAKPAANRNAADITCDTTLKSHPLPKHHASSSKHGTKVAHKKSKSPGEALSVTEAQEHLKNLGYYDGPIDGKLGPKTRAALKKFQKDYGLKPTGKLDARTMAALRAADQARKVTDVGNTPGSNLPTPAPAPTPDFFSTHPDFYGYYHQHYSDPMMLTHLHGDNPPTQALASRFGQLVMTEQPAIDTMKTYHVTLNGQPLFGTGDQPSVVLVSKTYHLNGEDAIVFTSYNDGDPVCSFENVLVTLKSDNTNSHYRIDNCTYGYEAEVKQNSLWIRFPEKDDKRAIGATFKYESGDLEKL